MWFGCASHLPTQTSTIHVNRCVVKPLTVVRHARTHWLTHLGRRPGECRWASTSHSWCCRQTCFYHLRRRVRAGHWHLGRDVTATIGTAAVTPCCSGWPPSFHIGTVSASRTHAAAAARTVLHLNLRHRVTARVAVQCVVLAWTHAALHVALTDMSCRSNCVPRRLATSSCRRHVDAPRAEPAAVDL